jgi:putative FmdB family regulatory protein
MPLYEYLCYKCGNSFEKLRRIADDDRELRCPACGSEKIERVLSSFSSRGCSGSSSGDFG